MYKVKRKKIKIIELLFLERGWPYPPLEKYKTLLFGVVT